MLSLILLTLCRRNPNQGVFVLQDAVFPPIAHISTTHGGPTDVQLAALVSPTRRLSSAANDAADEPPPCLAQYLAFVRLLRSHCLPCQRLTVIALLAPRPHTRRPRSTRPAMHSHRRLVWPTSRCADSFSCLAGPG